MFGGLIQRCVLQAPPAPIVAGAATVWAPATDITLTGGDLTAERTGTGGFWAPTYGTNAKNTGSWIAAVNALNGAAFQCFVGFSDGTETTFPGQSGNSGISYRDNGEIWAFVGVVTTVATYGLTDQIECVRTALGTFGFKKNGTFVWGPTDISGGAPGTNVVTAPLKPAFSSGSSTAGTKITANFGGW